MTGCSFKADYGGTRFRCDRDEPGACPPGQSCMGGFCEDDQEPSGDDDGNDGIGDGARADADVDLPDGPVADAFVLTCDSIGTFQEPFDSDERWLEIASKTGCDVSFADNQLTLRNDLKTPLEQCGVYSVAEFALDTRTWIAVLSPGNGHPAATFGLWIGEESILFRRVEDFIDLVTRDKNGVEMVALKVNANDPAQRLWALNPSEDGYVHWELSADGVVWTEYAKFKPQVSPTAGCVHYEISIDGDPTGAVDVIFDDLNVPPPDPPLDAGPS